MQEEAAAPAAAIARNAVVSSQIAAIGYEPATQTLAIEFLSKSGKPNSVYHYAGFSSADWAAFSNAESIGSHFYSHVKGKFPYARQADVATTAEA